MARATPAASIFSRRLSAVSGVGWCARAASPGGHGRSGVSAAEICTWESTIIMGSIQLHAGALDERAPDFSLPLEFGGQLAGIGDHELDPDLLELLARLRRGQAFCQR